MGFVLKQWDGRPLFRREVEGSVLISPIPSSLLCMRHPNTLFLWTGRAPSETDPPAGVFSFWKAAEKLCPPVGNQRSHGALQKAVGHQHQRHQKREPEPGDSGWERSDFSHWQFFLGRYADLAEAAAVVREAEKARDEVVGQLDQLQDRAGQELERRLGKLLEDFRDKRAAAAAGATEN